MHALGQGRDIHNRLVAQSGAVSQERFGQRTVETHNFAQEEGGKNSGYVERYLF